MKTLILVVLTFAPLSARAADAVKLRAALNTAYANAYSVGEMLGGVQKAYSLACKDDKSFTTLMALDIVISYSLETKETIAIDLAAAKAVAAADPAAHAVAAILVKELGAINAGLARILEPAKRCEEFMKAKDRALDDADSEGDDMTWDASRMHAGINVRRLQKFDATALLAAAREIEAKTKRP